MASCIAVEAPPGALVDAFGRVQDYLRLSVTDRCNFRCGYCVPAEGFTPCKPENLLTAGEIEAAVRCLAALGIRKVRLTGGEPLLRRGLPELVARLGAVPGIESLGLTTNGDRLAALARPLREAGLKSVNVSLDSLEAERFRAVTGGGRLERVWEGILEALACGLRVRLNCVALSDLCLEEVRRFVAVATALPVAIRFIERMPLNGGHRDPDAFVSLSELEERILLAWPGLVPAPSDGGVARRYRIRGGLGEFGFIASTSRPFCGDCSRLRLNAQGRLHTCLFSGVGTDLRPYLAGGDGEGMTEAVRAAVLGKPRAHGGDAPLTPSSPAPAGRIRTVGG